MVIEKQIVADLIKIFKIQYSDFENFSHPRFIKEERSYKIKAVDNFNKLLNRNDLDQLIKTEQYDEIIARIRKVGGTNLLYNAIPQAGDLNVLSNEKLNKEKFCKSFFGFLYGEQDILIRFNDFQSFLFSNDLNEKWTFSTYYLYLQNPKEDIFVKPAPFKWFLEKIGLREIYSKKPTGESYLKIREVAKELFNSLSEYSPQDMIDVQSFIYVSYRNSKAEVENMNSTDNIIKNCIDDIILKYIQTRTSETFSSNNPIWELFNRIQRAIMQNTIMKKYSNIQIKWSVGQGNWSKVPWIAFLDSRETQSTQNGVYCVILFRSDMSGVYLTFNQGVTKPINDLGRKGGHEFLINKKNEIRKNCQDLLNNGYILDDKIDLKDDSGLGRDYEISTIAYKLYEQNNVPNDYNIINDIDIILQAYDNYMNKTQRIIKPNTEAVSIPTNNEFSGFFKELIKSRYEFNTQTIENFLLSQENPHFVREI